MPCDINAIFDKTDTVQRAQYDLISDCLPAHTLRHIYTPTVCGAQKNVLIAQTSANEYVFKFNNPDMIRKNGQVSSIMRQHGVPVPETYIYEHNNLFAEVYPKLSGQTLHQHLSTGQMPKTELYRLYREIIKYFENMANIDFSEIDFHGFDTPAAVAKDNVHTTNGALMAKIVPLFVSLMNYSSGNNRGLFHHGITPKNIIIDSRGKISGFIDMDEVSICTCNYAFGVMAAKAALLGLSISELCDKYEQCTGQKLNRRYIQIIANVNNFGRNILWRQRKNKTK